MQLPTLPLSSNPYVYVEGDVSIDPNAAIAPGVMLRADSDSKIIIAAGVCIGMGSILHAHQGTLEVEAGANLGAGVLVVGQGKIGANACIGTITTIWNHSIEPWQVVPAGSVVGGRGRQIPDEAAATSLPSVSTVKESVNGQVLSPATQESTDSTLADPPTPSNQESSRDASPAVYGQDSLNRLMKTLFPYNPQSLNRPLEDG